LGKKCLNQDLQDYQERQNENRNPVFSANPVNPDSDKKSPPDASGGLGAAAKHLRTF
jgi:hypothetical protein